VISPSLLQLASETIAATAAFPIQGTALTPDLVGISFETTLSFASGITQADQSAIIATATAAAANYVNNLSVNSPLVINQLASAVLSSDSRIQDIGAPNDEICRSVFAGITHPCAYPLKATSPHSRTRRTAAHANFLALRASAA
jgi:hypothetical protein